MFVLGRDIRFDFVDTDLACYRTRGGFAVAGKHHDLDAALNPRYVVAFPGNGVTERLVIDAKTRRITVVDRRAVTSRSKTKG
jgi:hypothetical protein